MSILRAGDLDRRITILQRVNVRNEKTGTDKAVWTPLATVWAQVQAILPSRADRVADVVDIAKRPARVRIRWRSDVTIEMRIRFEDREYTIVSGPVEIGRRQGLEMLVEHNTSEGQRP